MLHLSSIEVQNFRAIRQARFEFDATTVFIGENDAGIGIVFEALEMVLNPAMEDRLPEFEIFHFHHDPDSGAGAPELEIVLELTLDKAAKAEETEELRIFPGLTKQSEKVEERFEVRVSAEQREQEIHTSWQCSNLRDGAVSQDPQLLQTIRTILPAIQLRPGALLEADYSRIKEEIAANPETDIIDRLAEEISMITEEIFERRTTDYIRSINKGFELVKELAVETNRSVEHLEKTARPPLKLREILRMVTKEETEGVVEALERFTDFNDKLGALLLVNALIQNSHGRLAQFSQPLLIFENPEAFLHNRTLATITTLIRRINWQKIFTTNSGLLLSRAPFEALRRIRRKDDRLISNRIDTRNYTNDDLRRITYHLRTHHNMATFSRFWILVEGESEFWVLPHLARIMNYDLFLEGITVIGFAQAGLSSLLKFAIDLGIGWHVMLDGDEAGIQYVSSIQNLLDGAPVDQETTLLEYPDIEHLFWHSGYADVFARWARLSKAPIEDLDPTLTIRRAIKFTSKPFLALNLIEAVSERGVDAIPSPLRQLMDHCIEMARIN